MKRDEKRNSNAKLLYVTEVYALQFMNILSSVFGATKTPQIKQEKKQRKTRIFNFISYRTLINQSETRDNFDCSYCHPTGKSSFFFIFRTVYSYLTT